MDRRTVLQGTLGACVGVSLAPLAGAATSAAPNITRVTEKISVVSGVKDNVVALSTGEGLLLVDSGSPDYTDALLGAMRRLPDGGRVQTLINTHWHFDQTGSNAALGKAGAVIIAQHNTKDRIETDHYNPSEDRYDKALAKAAWPTQTFYSTGSMTAGGEHIEYGYLVEAHTDGDCYVYFRDSNVLAVGHAASPTRDPQLDWFGGGWIGGRLDALTLLHNLANEETTIVPAFGPVVSRSALEAEHQMLLLLFNRMLDLLLKGYSAQEIFDAGVMNGVGRTWSDPKKFVYDAYKGLWAHHNAVSSKLV